MGVRTAVIAVDRRRRNRVDVQPHQFTQSRSRVIQHCVQVVQHLLDLIVERTLTHQVSFVIQRQKLPRVHERLALHDHSL
jgi:hypothetical protein